MKSQSLLLALSKSRLLTAVGRARRWIHYDSIVLLMVAWYEGIGKLIVTMKPTVNMIRECTRKTSKAGYELKLRRLTCWRL